MRTLILAAGISAILAAAGGASAQASAPRSQPALRDCGTFLQCLFGKQHPARVVKGGKPGHAEVNPSAPNHSVPDHATAQVISWAGAGRYTPGSLVIRTPERHLYYVLGNGQARRYSIGVGREGFQWSGNSKIVAKQQWPEWHPPEEMIAREAAKGHMLPDMMEGGPDNPLGARAMYIGGTMFRIHGTNNPGSIGGAVSSGCIRMMNTDVSELYDKVRLGAKVFVYQ